MKICILSGLYQPDERGGAERAARQIVLDLQKLGHEVFVITTRKKSRVENMDGAVVYGLSPANIFWYGHIGSYRFSARLVWHLIDMFNLAQAWRIKKILISERPDAVWSHNLKGLGYLAPRLIRRLNFRHIHTLHDIQLLAPSGLAVKPPVMSFYGRITRWLFGRVDVATAPSRWLLELHHGAGFFKNSQLVFLPHAFFAPRDRAADKNQAPRLLFLGQLEESKGVRWLIETLAEQASDLLIAGRGTLEAYLKNSKAHYLGFLNREALEELWPKINFLIVPSLVAENSPSVIYESLAHGVPVIAADIGGISELVENGRNGFLFKAGEAESLRQALQQAALVSSDELAEASRNKYQALREIYLRTLKTVIAPLSTANH